MSTQPTAHARLKTALRALVLEHPYFGHLALSLTLKRDTRARTIATDGQCLYYDEVFITAHEQDLVTLLAHEVLHPALFHHTRRGDRNLDLWNEAGDYAINLLLQDAGFQIPANWYIDPRFRGMTTERIFEALKSAQEARGSDSGDEPGAEGAGSGGVDELPDPSSRGDPDLSGQGPSPPRSIPGEVWDSPEPIQQEAEWQVLLKQAAGLATLMGRLPGGIAEVVEEAAQPRVDWRAVLRRFVQQFASADYSWRRPNRRCVASGVYVPELHADAMPAIVVVADTSASTRTVLDVFLAELRSIQEECQPEETILMMADAAVHRVDRFARDEPIECKFVGMGGTDFRPAFEYLDAQQIDPACLIYLTDGDGEYPETPSEFPTLWAITTPGTRAPWGETVTIEGTAD